MSTSMKKYTARIGKKGPMKHPKNNKKGKKVKTLDEEERDAHLDIDQAQVSKSIVYKRGDCNRGIKNLVKDFRRVMEPNTAAKLKEQKTNTTKDFANVAGLFGVTHLVAFSSTDIASYLAVGRLPKGPSTTFKINQYSLQSDISKVKLRPSSFANEYLSSPLVVLNGFGKGTPQLEMVTNMVQSMFPSINVFTLRLSKCKRVVLFNYDKETNEIEFRHYAIKVSDVGVNRSIKRVIQSRIPDISNLNDISDYVLGGMGASESDYEDAGDGQVELSSKSIKSIRENKKLENKLSNLDEPQKKAIKLEEIGPRMNLTLIKVEEDLFKGGVLYHQFVHKTDEQKHEIDLKIKEKAIEKERRKKDQEANVEKKKSKKDGKDNKRKYLDDESKFSDDDDEEWYRKEIGEDPDETFKSSSNNNSRGASHPRFKKKFKSKH